MIQKSIVIKEIIYKAIRSSGPGGQHANKVSSKVVLQFDLINSLAFSENEKHKLAKFFGSKVASEGVIQMSADENRSQHRNKKIVTDRFFELIKEALIVEKIRKKSKPSWSSVLKGKEAKKQQSAKKTSRKKPNID